MLWPDQGYRAPVMVMPSPRGARVRSAVRGRLSVRRLFGADGGASADVARPDSSSATVPRMAGLPTEDWFIDDRNGVEQCFGCGEANEAGLHLRFRLLPDGDIETRLRAPAHFQGVEGILHGGIQAAMLDEVMCVAAESSLPPDIGRADLVTAELSLRYLRPVSMRAEVIARARMVSRAGPDIYVHGEIVDADGRELTTARSRWRVARRPVSGPASRS